MEKVGKIYGDVWSEVRNVHSRHVYQILTHPELGDAYWVTHIFLMVQKKASCKFFGDSVHLCGSLLREPQLLPLLIEFDHF
jgi:hypothetical protein